MNTKKLLGQRIKEIRKQKGYNQSQLAEIVEVDPKHLSRIESGVNFPSLVLLDKMAVELDVLIKDFFEFNHLEAPKALIGDITKTLKSTDEASLRKYYRILKDLTL